MKMGTSRHKHSRKDSIGVGQVETSLLLDENEIKMSMRQPSKEYWMKSIDMDHHHLVENIAENEAEHSISQYLNKELDHRELPQKSHLRNITSITSHKNKLQPTLVSDSMSKKELTSKAGQSLQSRNLTPAIIHEQANASNFVSIQGKNMQL